MLTNRKQTDIIIKIIKTFNYKPEVIDPYLEKKKDVIGQLPLCMQIEIETEYKNVK